MCQALKAEPDTAVYWTARAKDFTAFVRAMDTNGTCIENDLTVLGGNELTNVALTGQYADKDWLRLYHSAHRLPEEDSRASAKTKDFVRQYNRQYPQDPWRQDGHSAVSYDAFHVLSRAVDYAGSTVRRESVLTALRNNITFDGATGVVSFSEFSSGPPKRKTLVILRQSAYEPEAVVACGAYSLTAPKQQDSPCRD